MPRICPRRWTRHTLHLFSYAFVSMSLMTIGLIFSFFAIFEKESILSKVWLAGPTTMAVALVLCGKVMIDWGPAINNDIESDDFREEETPFGPGAVTFLDPESRALVGSLDAQYIQKKDDGELCLENVAAKEADGSNVENAKSVEEKEGLLENNPFKTAKIPKKPSLKIVPNESPSPCTEVEIWSPRTDIDSKSPAVKYENSLFVTNPYASENSSKSAIDKSKKRNRERTSSDSSLYQGETFVLYDRQYLI